MAGAWWSGVGRSSRLRLTTAPVEVIALSSQPKQPKPTRPASPVTRQHLGRNPPPGPSRPPNCASPALGSGCSTASETCRTGPKASRSARSRPQRRRVAEPLVARTGNLVATPTLPFHAQLGEHRMDFLLAAIPALHDTENDPLLSADSGA